MKEAWSRHPVPARGDRPDVGSRCWQHCVARLDGGDLDADGKKAKRDFCHRAMDVHKPAPCITITTAYDNPSAGAFMIYGGMANRGHPGYPGSQPQFRKMSHQQAMRLMSIDITYPFMLMQIEYSDEQKCEVAHSARGLVEEKEGAHLGRRRREHD